MVYCSFMLKQMMYLTRQKANFARNLSNGSYFTSASRSVEWYYHQMYSSLLSPGEVYALFFGLLQFLWLVHTKHKLPVKSVNPGEVKPLLCVCAWSVPKEGGRASCWSENPVGCWGKEDVIEF